MLLWVLIDCYQLDWTLGCSLGSTHTTQTRYADGLLNSNLTELQAVRRKELRLISIKSRAQTFKSLQKGISELVQRELSNRLDYARCSS